MNFKNILKVAITVLTITAALLVLSACNRYNYDYKTDISDIKDILNTTDDKYLVLVNKDHKVDDDYAPESVEQVRKDYTNGGKEIELESNVKLAAEALIAEMRAEGIDDVYITSGYRSYAYQAWLFTYYCELEKEAEPSLSDKEIEKKVLSYSAFPGTSEHHTGLCMDLFVSPDMRELENYGHEGHYKDDVGFAETEAFTWLKHNAHKFGFILRYPEDKVNVTKYSYESWHYRFVGIKAATEIYEKGITLEEYLSK